MVEGIQYGGGISSVRWKIFSTNVSHHQYGGASSVQWRACSMDLSHDQYREGCAMEYMDTDTVQGVVGGCICLGK